MGQKATRPISWNKLNFEMLQRKQYLDQQIDFVKLIGLDQTNFQCPKLCPLGDFFGVLSGCYVWETYSDSKF